MFTENIVGRTGAVVIAVACVSVCVCGGVFALMCTGAFEGQKRVSDPLKLDYRQL